MDRLLARERGRLRLQPARGRDELGGLRGDGGVLRSRLQPAPFERRRSVQRSSAPASSSRMPAVARFQASERTSTTPNAYRGR